MPQYDYPVDGPTHRSIRLRNAASDNRKTLIVVAAMVVFMTIVGTIVYFALGLNVHSHANCEILQVASPKHSNVEVWEVTTSCGTHAINSGDFLDLSEGARIAESLVPGGTYDLTFSGNDRDVVAAVPVGH
jgi:hypothetical protein